MKMTRKHRMRLGIQKKHTTANGRINYREWDIRKGKERVGAKVNHMTSLGVEPRIS